MAREAETSEKFLQLGINELNKELVDAVWDSDFTLTPDLPATLKRQWANHRDVLSYLRDAIDCCTPWARIDFATLPQGFWTVLCENGIVPRSLLVGLHHFINRVDSLLSSAVEREIAIAAAHLYTLLLEIPGSGAYRVQQPMLFEAALNTLKLWPKTDNKRKRANPSDAHKKRNTASQHQQRNAKKSRRLNTGRPASRNATAEEDEREDGDEDEDDDDAEDVVALTTHEVDRIQRAIFHVIKEVVYLLRNVPLKSSEQIVEQVLLRLAEVCRMPTEQDFESQFGTNVSLDNVHTISHLAYMGLEALCSGSHGDEAHMLRMVFKHLLPSILMLIGENQAVATSTIPKHIQLMKDHVEAFASHMYKELGEKALPCVRVLLQHMCVKVPDKMEYRTRVSHTIARILATIPPTAEASFVQWLYMYSKNAKISHRVFALEVVSALLERPERQSSGNEGEDGGGQEQFLSHRFLLDIMISRCSDRAPTVRAKALSCFAQFTALAGNAASGSIPEMLAAPTAKTGKTPALALAPVIQQQEAAEAQKASGNDGSTAMDCGTAEGGESSKPRDDTIETASEADNSKRPSEAKKGATPGNLMGGSPALLFGDESGEGFVGSGNLLSCLKERVQDDKVGVRKAALQALENVFKLKCMAFDLQLLEILRERCRDTALSVRKQALDSLTSLLKENMTDERVQRVWLQGVLPVVSDRESTASEKCLQLFQELVLDGVCKRGTSEATKQLAWSLLRQLMQPELCELRVYFQRVCRLWARQKLLSPSLVQALASHISGDNAVAAWMFLSQVTHFYPNLDKALVLQTWRPLTSDLPDRSLTSDMDTQQGSTSPEVLTSLLSVIGSLAGKFTEEERKEIVGEITKRLVNALESPNIIGAMVETLYKLSCASAPENATTHPLLDEACDTILQACDTYLSGVLLTESAPKVDEATEEMLIGRIFLLGEVAQLCPYRMPRRVFTLVQSLLAGAGQVSEGSELPSSQGLTQFSQAPPSQFRCSGSAVSKAVRAHAFVTLGKLCLHHEGLAKQCIAALARELEIAEDAAVRNNVALVMCDLCIRYPNLVDRYVPNLATCLKDKDKLVRKQSLTQLTQLVLEDYVKWRGPLFFRFVSVIVDEVDSIRDFAEYCLVELLLKRHPGMLMQQFVESVFHFNNYQKHAVFNQFTQSDRERALFSLEGAENAEKRMTIFRFMLRHINDEQRFKLTGKLTQDVLGAFVDGALPFDLETSALLQDTLKILCCKEIKLASLNRHANPDDIVEEMQMAEAVMAQAKSKLISQVVKKNMVENVIPVIIALKHMLEKQHSPVLGDLMLFLKELMKDYRNEIKDIFAADRQLASEIEFDLRKFDEQQQQQEEEAARQTLQQAQPKTPGRVQGADRAPTPGALKTPQLLSPKTVAGRSPAVIRNSPKTPTTKNAPTKERLLAAQAIVNSARKALASARSETTPGRNASPRVVGRTPVAPRPTTPLQSTKPTTPASSNKRSGDADAETADVVERVGRVELSESGVRDPGLRSPLSEVNDENTSKESLPEAYRAISTPDKTISNITFQAGMDMSIIPLSSPIPSSLPIRVYSEQDPRRAGGTKSWTPQLESDQEVKVKKENLIFMFSPEQPAPKPRVWNITSPGPAQKSGGGRRPLTQATSSASSSDEQPQVERRSGRGSRRDSSTESQTRSSRTRSKAR